MMAILAGSAHRRCWKYARMRGNNAKPRRKASKLVSYGVRCSKRGAGREPVLGGLAAFVLEAAQSAHALTRSV